MKDQNNAKVIAKLVNGYVHLYLNLGEIKCEIKVNDYAGQYKKRAKALTYKIYKTLEG